MRVEGYNIATDLPSIFLGRRGNLNDDDMKELQEQGFDVNDNSIPNTENVSEPTLVAINYPPVLYWKTDCIVCPWRAEKLQNLFVSFCNYSKANVMKISRLDMFLIMMPMKFIEYSGIKKTNEILGVPMNTQEYIKWVGCWLYMPCQFLLVGPFLRP